MQPGSGGVRFSVCWPPRMAWDQGGGRNTKDPLSDSRAGVRHGRGRRTQGTVAGCGEARREGHKAPLSSSWQGAPRAGGRGQGGGLRSSLTPGTSGPLTKDDRPGRRGAEQAGGKSTSHCMETTLLRRGGTGWGTTDRVQAREDGVGVLQALIPKLLLCQRRRGVPLEHSVIQE